MDDIELRAAELLLEYSKSATEVITLAQVEQVITVMGKPEDFQPEADGDNSSHRAERMTVQQKNPKRLYRNIDDKFLAGVSGGLGSYFSIDPVVFRILFVALTFIGGIGPIIYILLWIIVPPATSRAQKLEMRGDRITIDNIGKMVSGELEGVKQSWKKKSTFNKPEVCFPESLMY